MPAFAAAQTPASPATALADAERANDPPAILTAARALAQSVESRPANERAPSRFHAALALHRAGAPDAEVLALTRLVIDEPIAPTASYEFREAHVRALALQFAVLADAGRVDDAIRAGEVFAEERWGDFHPYVIENLRRLADLYRATGRADRVVPLVNRIAFWAPASTETATWLLGAIAGIDDREVLRGIRDRVYRWRHGADPGTSRSTSVMAGVHLRLARLAWEAHDLATAAREREQSRGQVARASLSLASIAEAMGAGDLGEFEHALAATQRTLGCDGHGHIDRHDIDALDSELVRLSSLRARLAWYEVPALEARAFLREEAVRESAVIALGAAASRCAVATDPSVAARIERMERDADRIERTDRRRADALRIDAAVERERTQRAASLDPAASAFEQSERTRIRALQSQGTELSRRIGPGGRAAADPSASPRMAEHETRALARWDAVR